MRFAYPSQRLQDWLSQQWVIWRGQRFDPDSTPWLMGPYGYVDSIADEFISRLASDEHLEVERNARTGGLLSSIHDLALSETDYQRLAPRVIDFYENTTQYELDLQVKWNPWFRPFGGLIRALYSRRLKQLNLPLRPLEVSRGVYSEVVNLTDPQSGETKYTVWYRILKSNGNVMYSGIYTTCTLPSGRVCVKAIFPLPRGNATVILEPTVAGDGKLRLTSSGKGYGDPGFYFLLFDSKGGHWVQYIRSFREQIDVFVDDSNQLRAEHALTLWKQSVIEFKYEMNRSVGLLDHAEVSPNI